MQLLNASVYRLVVLASVVLAASVHGQTLPSGDYLYPPPQPLPFSYVKPSADIPPPPEMQAPTQFVTPAQYGMGYMSGPQVQPAADDPYSATSLCPTCTACPNRGLYGFMGYDSWRGYPDDGWGNNGLHAGLNFGTRLGRVSDWTGVGFQLGSSVGVYNWSGTDYHLSRTDQATMQGFVTYGFFRKANEQSNWSAAVVEDWMITSNYGIFAENPTMAQWRGQIGYAFGPLYEVGLWGTWRGQGDTRNVPSFGPTAWRPVQQISTYVHYKWGAGGPNSWVSFGVPEVDRLEGGGSLGDYVVSAITNCPLSDRVMLYAQVTYMHPSGRPGFAAAAEDTWAFLIGLSFFPARNARTDTVAGECWMPQVPVANNGYFLVDTSQTY